MAGEGEQGESAPPAGSGSQPQAGTEPPAQDAGAQTEQASGAAAEVGTSAASQDDGEKDAQISRLRRESAGLRTEVSRLKKADEERKTADLSESERMAARIAALESEKADLEKKDSERQVRLAVMEAATTMNFRNPEVAYRLVDQGDVEADAEGNPTNIGKLLKAIAEKEPYLLKPNTATPDFGGGQRGSTPPESPDMNVLLRRASGH